MLVLSVLLLSSVVSSQQESCVDEITRDREEDWTIHGCRSCKPIKVDATANCPKKGYHCDPALIMTSNVLATGGCDCSQIRCVDANATLAVGGELVTKVHCNASRWMYSREDVASSAVCARKCGLGVCSTLSEEFYSAHPDFVPFQVNPPDDVHPCAWGSCPDGAMAGNSIPDQSYPGPVQFSCAGDRSWSFPDENRFNNVACKRKQCHSLVSSTSTELCGKGKPYACYDPQFVDDDSGIHEKKMTCKEPNALRYTNDDKTVSPVCSLGQWTDGGKPIENETKVMCVSCNDIYLSPDGVETPILDKDKKQVTCTNKEYLSIALARKGDLKFTYIKVDSVKCNGQFEWDAYLDWKDSSSELRKYTSLSAAIRDNLTVEVDCCNKFPDC